MDEINEKIQKVYIETILERKFDLGSGHLGNGISVYNKAKEVHGDYEKIAHIDRNRKVTYYIKNPPKQVKDYIEKIAKGNNPNISATQSGKVFKESVDNDLNEASEVEFTDFDKKKQDFIAKLVGKSNMNKQTYFSGIHGTIVSLHDGMRPAMRLSMSDIKNLAKNKDIRWIDVESIGMGYNVDKEK
jgi:hypothetical protein